MKNKCIILVLLSSLIVITCNAQKEYDEIKNTIRHTSMILENSSDIIYSDILSSYEIYQNDTHKMCKQLIEELRYKTEIIYENINNRNLDFKTIQLKV